VEAGLKLDYCRGPCTLIKKKNEIFLIYMEIQMGTVEKSYIYEEGLPNI
jgi:hypothetical protein